MEVLVEYLAKGFLIMLAISADKDEEYEFKISLTSDFSVIILIV